MNLPGKLAARGTTDTHEWEVYEYDGYYQGQWRGRHGNVPTCWNRGYGSRDLKTARDEVLTRIGWESIIAADAGRSLRTGPAKGGDQ